MATRAPPPTAFELGSQAWFEAATIDDGPFPSEPVAPPLIFTGLFLALWAWKCLMMVLFQNAIIYNPFMPPNARSMRIADVARECRGIRWREERIRSLDGTEIALCISEDETSRAGVTPVYVLYFQGNASSLPPRLPDLSWVLRRLRDTDPKSNYTFVGLSYRGYWTSHDRPYEKGINKDSEAALRWISKFHRTKSQQEEQQPVVVLYGQSIGCGLATNLAATTRAMSIDALVLETPFVSTRAMLTALYPQRWLPYQYLWPFLRNHMDSWANFGVIASASSSASSAEQKQPAVYMVHAGKDELVPAEQGETLYQRCQHLGLSVQQVKVRGALHNEAIIRMQGKEAIAKYLTSAVEGARARAHVATASEPRHGEP
ncbi:Alpha beta superfamily hydrolase [Geosmithia morbida]|uniref:Alpha beta superfamily hydrolase n=1 Tax=Geosmithia morbida TaxID=1094350 RepID=A0A9P5D2Q9_9HYPO|nr:Alpha beta superfamily hydrolase [Geosmithia morbida]KAF4121726.1 Alpha beta superfamily hydrolase [Geosmithia morbida]